MYNNDYVGFEANLHQYWSVLIETNFSLPVLLRTNNYFILKRITYVVLPETLLLTMTMSGGVSVDDDHLLVDIQQEYESDRVGT